jgi:hypothetical protein
VNGQREWEKQKSVGEEIVRRHSNLLGCQVWETYIGTNDLSVNKGPPDEVELTDHGSTLETQACFLLCTGDN